MYLSWVEDKRRRRQKDLPSWVPDLSIEMAPLPPIGNKEYHATPSWRYEPSKSRGDQYLPWCPMTHCRSVRIDRGDRILPLVGLEFDTIQEVSELIPTATEESMFLPLLEMAFSLPHRSSSGYDRLEVLMRTLVADRVDRSTTDQNKNNIPIAKVTNSFIAWLFNQICMALVKGKGHRRGWMDDASFMTIRGISLLGPESPCFDTYLAMFSRFFDLNKAVQSEDFTKDYIEPSQLYSSMYDKTIWIRRLARTRKNNLLCLTAPSTAPGDQIWYLQGGRLPFVFRELPNGNFDLRGEAYVHGCMSGEVFTKYGLKIENAREIRVE
jgi:hypothetical protein